MISIAWGAATHRGRVRAINEDSPCLGAAVFAVADGMGGHDAGEVASALVVGELQPLGAQGPLMPEDVSAGISRANQRILDYSARHGSTAGMGTTLSGVALVLTGGGEHWMVFNVGDSRVYRVLDRIVEQLTVDHSEVAELVATGELTSAEARHDRRRHIVTRALGTDPAPVVDVWLLPPSEGERYVVCSDGIFNELADAELFAAMTSPGTPEDVAALLVARAVEAGGRDNATAVIVDTIAVSFDGNVEGDTAPRPPVGSSA
ncbi:MAG: protein phosphatase [Frankiales bacterium]|nr:protein phosphatase [Frankiales bacterium]